ncbi:hypothetical protein ABZ858_33655 [Streptomyces sp. NPDC047017]|uniref:hypothetical protein n=1 Tax=Streptomyces sp. NPDC047017 TaxID=3155024 RepID=UPI0033D93EC0
MPQSPGRSSYRLCARDAGHRAVPYVHAPDVLLVAGSGRHGFTYRVTNVSKVKVMETDVSLDLGTADRSSTTSPNWTSRSSPPAARPAR